MVENLRFLKETAEVGEHKTVIDRLHALELTASAFKYVEKRQKKGYVVIKVVRKVSEAREKTAPDRQS